MFDTLLALAAQATDKHGVVYHGPPPWWPIVPIFWLLFIVVVAATLWWLLHHTNYGRLLFAIGDNPRAAQLAGVPIERVRILAFVVSSLSATVTGVLVGGFSGVSPDAGAGYELGTNKTWSVFAPVIGIVLTVAFWAVILTR